MKFRCHFGHNWDDPYKWDWGGILVMRQDCRRCDKSIVTNANPRTAAQVQKEEITVDHPCIPSMEVASLVLAAELKTVVLINGHKR